MTKLCCYFFYCLFEISFFLIKLVKLLEKITFQLFDVVYREETLLNVIRSVTRNGRSIILTAVLALILVYMFSIIGYMFFKDDFLVSVDEEIICESFALIPTLIFISNINSKVLIV